MKLSAILRKYRKFRDSVQKFENPRNSAYRRKLRSLVISYHKQTKYLICFKLPYTKKTLDILSYHKQTKHLCYTLP